MYGLVNRALEEWIVEEAGASLWDAVRRRAGLGITGFVGTDHYPDRLTADLVAAASDVLGRPTPELLRAFGRHWIVSTGAKAYGPLLELAGGSVEEFLSNLGALHRRMQVGMPGLELPEIACRPDGEDGEALCVSYRSHREGLAPMVVGLLEGLGERFGTPVSVTHRATGEAGHACDEFRVELRAAP